MIYVSIISDKTVNNWERIINIFNNFSHHIQYDEQLTVERVASYFRRVKSMELLLILYGIYLSLANKKISKQKDKLILRILVLIR